MRIKRVHYTRKDGTFVRGTSFNIKDRGKPGRGPKLIKLKKPGSLGGQGFFSRATSAQKAILNRAVRKEGEMPVQGKLQAISTFNKRTNPIVSRKAKMLRTWVANRYD